MTAYEQYVEADMKKTVEQLVKKKKEMIESEEGRHIDELNLYMEANLLYFKEKVSSMEDDRNPDWDELDSIFREIVMDVSIGHSL